MIEFGIKTHSQCLKSVVIIVSATYRVILNKQLPHCNFQLKQCFTKRYELYRINGTTVFHVEQLFHGNYRTSLKSTENSIQSNPTRELSCFQSFKLAVISLAASQNSF